MSAHKYWRLLINSINGYYVTISTLELRGTVGGADQCTGGTATASSQYSTQAPGLAFDGNGSTFWESGDESGFKWLKYEFASDVEVAEFLVRSGPYSAEQPFEFYLEHSDDNSTWTATHYESGEFDWSTYSERAYAVNQTGDNVYWRLNVAAADGSSWIDIAEFELFETSGGTDLCSGGKASANSTYGKNLFGASYRPDKAVDNDNATFWSGGNNSSGLTADGTGWLRYRLNTGADVVEYSVRAKPDGNRAPTNWTLEKSLDGVAWTVMDTRTSETGWTAGERRVYSFGPPPGASPRPVVFVCT